jgi:hypothetical protein
MEANLLSVEAKQGVLPRLINELVKHRKHIKEYIKSRNISEQEYIQVRAYLTE